MTLTTAQAFDRFRDAVSLHSTMSASVTQRRNAVDAVMRQVSPSTSTMSYQSSYLSEASGVFTLGSPD